MAVVREQYGPTLVELLRPRLRALPRIVRVALVVLLALVVAGIVVLALRGSSDARTHVVVREPIAFNLLHGEGLRRAQAGDGELLRLVTVSGARAPESMVVHPLQLPAYEGDVSATLALMAGSLIGEMREAIPGFVWRGDGRVVINRQPGHQISYQARIDGQTVYGRRVLLVASADPSPREGLDLTLLSTRSNAVPNADAVGANGILKLPYRSLRFGTERP